MATNNASDQLMRLRQDDPDVASVLDVYSEIERVYSEALQAMGVSKKISAEVKNSADVIVSFEVTPLSSSK